MCTSSAAVLTTQHSANLTEGPARPTKLFIGGISRHTTTKTLRDHFSNLGRVLDCVAMRTQDGHPRGFGYVTLDCPTAAEQCLCEPQVIDSRVVDMKLAVPEGSSAGTATRTKQPNFNANMLAGQAAFNMDVHAGHYFNEWSSAYGNATPWWSGDTFCDPSAMDCQYLDCLDLLRAPNGMQQVPGLSTVPGARHSVLNEHAELGAQDSMGLLLPPFLSSELDHSSSLPTDFQQLAGTPPKMSASAPEFVPLGIQCQEPAKNSRKAGRAKGPLMDLTNVSNAVDILKPFKSPIKRYIGSGYLSAPNSESPAADKSGSIQIPSAGKALFEEDEQKTNSPSEDTSVGASPSSLDSSLESPSTSLAPPGLEAARKDTTVEPDQEDCQINLDANEAGAFLSCSGSENDGESDSAGEVLEADLPSIGSALHSAGECKRCNFFLKGRCQNGKDCAFCHFPHDKRKHSRQEKRDRKASCMEDGYGKDSQELAGPLLPGLLGQTRPAALSADAAPWQPEAEASPAAYMLAMSENNPWSLDQQFVSSAPLTCANLAIFSTVPTPASSVGPTPNASCFPTPMPTPSGGAAPRMMFSTSVTDYMRPEAEASKTSPEAEAASSIVEWSRGDLLRLREGLMKMTSVDKVGVSIGIRTAAITATGVF